VKTSPLAPALPAENELLARIDLTFAASQQAVPGSRPHSPRAHAASGRQGKANYPISGTALLFCPLMMKEIALSFVKPTF
jgi:hypothetical protein